MFIVTHYSIPFYSYYFCNRRLISHDTRKSLLIYASIAGLAGILPDLTNIHISLSARHNSLFHTIWGPLITLALTVLLLCSVKGLRKSLLFWIPFGAFIHLVLDGISGGIRLLYPSPQIFGTYYVAPQWWFVLDGCFLLLLCITYRFDAYKSRLQQAETYN